MQPKYVTNTRCIADAIQWTQVMGEGQRINRIVIDVDFVYYHNIIHLPATKTTRVKAQGERGLILGLRFVLRSLWQS